MKSSNKLLDLKEQAVNQLQASIDLEPEVGHVSSQNAVIRGKA